MTHLVCQYVELRNGDRGQQDMVGERPEGASVRVGHAPYDEDGDREPQRNRDGVPSGDVLGEELARGAELVDEGAGTAADVQRGGRCRFLDELDVRFPVRLDLHVEPLLERRPEEVDRGPEVGRVDERSLVVGEAEYLLPQLLLRSGEEAGQDVGQTAQQAVAGQDNAHYHPDDRLDDAPDLFEGFLEFVGERGEETHGPRSPDALA